MMKDKNIDRLFQENLKDFEVLPSPKVWKNIEQKLTKKKRRILPMWWFGAAASLLIGVLLYPLFIEKQVLQQDKNTPIITNISEEKIDKTLKEKDAINNQFINIEKEQRVVNSDKNKNIINKLKSNKNQINKPIFKGLSSQENTFIIAEKKPQEKRNRIDLVDKNITITKDKNKEKKRLNLGVLDEKVAVKKNTIQSKKQILKPTKSLLAEVKKQTVKPKESKKQKWAVQSVFGVVNSGSFSGSSPIDADLKNSPISGVNTIAYGVNVSLKLNKKWSVQSGIHLQQTEYNTQNLAIISGTNTIAASQNINGVHNLGFTIGSLNNIMDIAANLSSQTIISNNATLNQTYSYFEIPLEVKYNVLNINKFNTSLIGGFSTLILNKNEISIASETLNQALGGATNLNSINFSGNLGIDLNYSFDKNWQFNITPMFKAQLNTFSKNSNGFKPYFIGVYTGINYQF